MINTKCHAPCRETSLSVVLNWDYLLHSSYKRLHNDNRLFKNLKLCVCGASLFRRLNIRGFSGPFPQLDQPDSLYGTLTTARTTDKDFEDGFKKVYCYYVA